MIKKILIFLSCIVGIFSFTDTNEVISSISNSKYSLLNSDLFDKEEDFNTRIENNYVQRVRSISDDESINSFVNDKGEEYFRVLDFIGLVEKYPGYKAEEHHIITADGYNLTLHRIRSSPQFPEKVGKPVVYIQHGLFLSSDAYVLLGPRKDLAFRLAENNYDVWIGNARGNTYSKSHIYKSTADCCNKFWNFSFHEIGKYDLSSSVDYIIGETESNSLKIIGYSLGATATYIFLSEFPEYNNKVDLLISIAPMAFWENSMITENFNVKKMLQNIEKIQKATGREDVYPQLSFTQNLWYSYDSRKNYDDFDFYKQILISSFGQIESEYNEKLIQRIINHVPAGTSVKNVKHLLQIINSGELHKYSDTNSTLVNYDLTKITTANTVFTGNDETFVKIKDLSKLFQESSNVAIHRLKTTMGQEINSLDFPWGWQADILNSVVLGLF